MFEFKIESPVDRLIENVKISTNVLEQRFIHEHLRRDVQFVNLEANVLTKRRYNVTHHWEEFEVGDQIWFRMDKVYRPKSKPNKCEMPRRQGSYTVIKKVSLLAYKLDIPIYTKIHPVISMVYLLQYRIYKDLYHRVLPSPSPIECGSDSETSADEVQDGQH